MYMVLCLPVVNPLPLVGDGYTSVWGPRGVLRVARLGAVAGVLQATREMSTVHEASAQVGHTWVGKCGGPRPDSSSSPDHPTLTTQIPQQCVQPQGGTKKGPSASRHSHRIYRSAPYAGDGGAAFSEPSSDRRSSRAARQEGAHPEAGVEVDVVGLAHLVVTFLRTVQGSDADGGSPV